jgi:hypothetical protein
LFDKFLNLFVFSEEKDSIEYVHYRASPMQHPYFINFIFGDFNCRDSAELFDYTIKVTFIRKMLDSKIILKNVLINKLKICSLNGFDVTSELFNILSDQVKLIFEHLLFYTKKTYDLDKIDVVVLPEKSVLELVQSSDIKTTSLGLVYVSESLLREYDTNDYIKRIRVKFQLTNLLSKQLAKHWFYNSNELHCDSVSIYEYENDLFMEKIRQIKSHCQMQNQSQSHQNQSQAASAKAERAKILDDLALFEKCHFYKALVNWIGYMAFQSVYPDLIDLVLDFLKFLVSTLKLFIIIIIYYYQVTLEWNLIKQMDSDYFLDQKNMNLVYEEHDFPRLTEQVNFQDVRNEMKNLIFVRTLFSLVGKEKFQSLIRDWFKIMDMSRRYMATQQQRVGPSAKSAKNVTVSSVPSEYELIESGKQLLRQNSSLLTILQQVIHAEN